MSTVQFHRRFKAELPVPHFCEEWHVHAFDRNGHEETYRVSFKLNRFEKPCYDVQLQTPSGGFLPVNNKTHFDRIKRVMSNLKDEFDDYRNNRNYPVRIT